MAYRKSNMAKRVDRSCGNNGSCPHCTSSRLHARVRAIPADEKEQFEMLREPDAEEKR